MNELLLLNRRRMLAISAGAVATLFGCGTAAPKAGERLRRIVSDAGPARAPDSDAMPSYPVDDAGSPTGYAAGDARAAALYPDVLLPDARDDAGIIVTPACRVTDDNILGPYYKDGAPFRNDIRDGQSGELMIVSGTVLGLDGCTPLAGAVIDVWQANADGAYDTAGYTLRGRMQADYAGRYSLTTIFPGRYLNGTTYRPAHVHYRVSHPNNVDLTTQLYFEGDPYNATDPYIVDSLIMPIGETRADAAIVRQVTFDIVLA